MADYTPYPHVHYLHNNSIDAVIKNKRLIAEGHPNAPHEVYSWSKMPDPLIIEMAECINSLIGLAEKTQKNFEIVAQNFELFAYKIAENSEKIEENYGKF